MALPGAQAAPQTPGTTPQPSAPAKMSRQAGMLARARSGLLAARKAVQQALAMIDDTSSEEGKAAIAALKALQGISGDASPGLTEHEGMALKSGSVAQPPAGPPGGGGAGMAGPQPNYPLGKSEQGFMGTGMGA